MHVAVLGAGYAGITLARSLESRLPADVALTVVDERDTHLVQHLVHRVVREPNLAADLQIPLDELLDRADHRQARVESIDPAAGRVTLDDGELDYDVGAVCLGAQTADYGLPGVPTHGMPLKRVRHALAIRDRFRQVGETGGRVVVGGGGTSGVQVAGELAEMARHRHTAVDVELIEQLETVVPGFPPAFQRAVRNALEARGVAVRTGTAVERATEGAVVLEDGTEVPYDQFVWTGGITGQDAMESQRPDVPATLRLSDSTFALGDAARVLDADGAAVPASAQTAVAQARVAARNVTALVEHRRGPPDAFEPRLDRFRYNPRGWLVSVGDDAVAQVGPTVLQGAPARAIKSSVAVGYLGSVGRLQGAVDVVRDHLTGVGA